MSHKKYPFFERWGKRVHRVHEKTGDDLSHVPVVDEQLVRCVAGINFAITFCAVVAAFHGNFDIVKAWTPILFFDALMRLTFGMKFSLAGALAGGLLKAIGLGQIWRDERPIRFVQALLMMNATVVGVLAWNGIEYAKYFAAAGATAMWLLSAADFCVGCWVYRKLVENGILTEAVAPGDCMGGVCAMPAGVPAIPAKKK